MTSYRPSAGSNPCRPTRRNCPGSPFHVLFASAPDSSSLRLAPSIIVSDGSTRSTTEQTRSSSSSLTRPTPAPQSAAVRTCAGSAPELPLPQAASAASNLSGPSAALRNALLSRMSAPETWPWPPRTPS